MSRAASGQLSLLDWQPPTSIVRFPPERTRAATLDGRVCKALSAALADCEMSREEIAAAMSAYLGQRVSLPMLNAYVSQARDDHSISVPRFAALLHVIRDRRPMEMLAEMMGWAVIDRAHLPLIELAAVQERRDELARRADTLRRQARAGGAL